MREFMRIALERDPRSLAFLDEVRSHAVRAAPSPSAPPACPRQPPDPGGTRVVFDTGSDSDRHALERLDRRHDRLAHHRHRPTASRRPSRSGSCGTAARSSSTATGGRSATRTCATTRGSRSTSTTTGAATTSSSSRARRGSTTRRRGRTTTPPYLAKYGDWIRELFGDRRGVRVRLQRPAPDPPDARPRVRRVSGPPASRSRPARRSPARPRSAPGARRRRRPGRGPDEPGRARRRLGRLGAGRRRSTRRCGSRTCTRTPCCGAGPARARHARRGRRPAPDRGQRRAPGPGDGGQDAARPQHRAQRGHARRGPAARAREALAAGDLGPDAAPRPVPRAAGARARGALRTGRSG